MYSEQVEIILYKDLFATSTSVELLETSSWITTLYSLYCYARTLAK